MITIKKLGLALSLSLLTACASTATTDRPSPQYGDTRPRYNNPPPPSVTDPSRNRPNPALEAEIAELWRTFPGKTGIAVKRIDGRWEIGHRANQNFPQQSVSKLMGRFDRDGQSGSRAKISMSDAIRIGPEDLTLFHQPLGCRSASEKERS